MDIWEKRAERVQSPEAGEDLVCLVTVRRLVWPEWSVQEESSTRWGQGVIEAHEVGPETNQTFQLLC